MSWRAVFLDWHQKLEGRIMFLRSGEPFCKMCALAGNSSKPGTQTRIPTGRGISRVLWDFESPLQAGKGQELKINPAGK